MKSSKIMLSKFAQHCYAHHNNQRTTRPRVHANYNAISACVTYALAGRLSLVRTVLPVKAYLTSYELITSQVTKSYQ